MRKLSVTYQKNMTCQQSPGPGNDCILGSFPFNVLATLSPINIILQIREYNALFLQFPLILHAILHFLL
jgi:hypothetical protein